LGALVGSMLRNRPVLSSPAQAQTLLFDQHEEYWGVTNSNTGTYMAQVLQNQERAFGRFLSIVLTEIVSGLCSCVLECLSHRARYSIWWLSLLERTGYVSK
jgi:hypothetical protein